MHASYISIFNPPQHSCYKNVIPKPDAGCNILMLNLASHFFSTLESRASVAKISFYSKGFVAFILTGMHLKERIPSLLLLFPGVINPNLSF